MAPQATGDTTVAAPALTSSRARPYMAWAAGGGVGGGEPDLRLNVQRLGGDKVVLDEWSAQAPALATSTVPPDPGGPVVAEPLYLAWTGNDPVGRLNVMSSLDGRSFAKNPPLDDTAHGGPALAVYQGLVVRAWTGGGGLGGGAPDGHLNLAWSPDGVTWPGGDRIVLPHMSASGPALAGIRDVGVDPFRDGRLWLAWIDAEGQIFVANCPGTDFGQLATNVERVGSERTFTSPCLATGENGPWLSWAGVDGAHKINFMSAPGSAGPFRDKKTVGSEFATSGIAMNILTDTYAYRGTDRVGRIYLSGPLP